MKLIIRTVSATLLVAFFLWCFWVPNIESDSEARSGDEPNGVRDSLAGVKSHASRAAVVGGVEQCKALEGVHESQITPTEIGACDQFNPLVWSYIKRHHVIPPSELFYPFPTQGPSNIVTVVWPILQSMTKGQKKKIFVEAGASEGVMTSHTIWLEQTHGWTGLLVECHPEVVPALGDRQRKAYIIDACLSTSKYPSRATLKSVDGWSYSSSMNKDGSVFPEFAKAYTEFEVQTMPLYAMLKALEIDTVDFFSLDIQSLEPKVLATFPFDKIWVKVWVIEINLITPQEKEGLVNLMVDNGYIVSDMIDKGASDLVFITKRRK